MRKGLRGVALAAALATALSLSACSGGGSSSGASSGSGSELVIWHMESVPTRVEAWNKLADEYNATNPQYKVKFEVQEWDQVYSKIAAAAQSKTQPDVLFAIPDFATYVRNLGLGQDVTSMVDAIGKDHPLLDAATASYTDGGKIYAVPLYGMVQVLWYRQDKFAEAGITQAPATWSELKADAEKLTTGDTSGIALPAGKNLASDQVLYSLMVAGGAGNMFNDDGSVNLDTPNTVDAFQLYDDLLAYSPQDSASYAWAEPQAAFNSGAAAMAIEKGQYLSPWKAESGLAPDQLGCAPIPVKDDGGKAGSIYYSNAAMVLTEDKARQEGADAFFTWVFQDDHYGPFLNAEPGLFLPVTKAGSELASWRSNDVVSTYADCVDTMLEQSETGELFGFVDGQYISRIGDISGQNILAQAVQKMYVDGQTPQEAVTWAQAEMQSAIE